MNHLFSNKFQHCTHVIENKQKGLWTTIVQSPWSHLLQKFSKKEFVICFVSISLFTTQFRILSRDFDPPIEL